MQYNAIATPSMRVDSSLDRSPPALSGDGVSAGDDGQDGPGASIQESSSINDAQTQRYLSMPDEMGDRDADKAHTQTPAQDASQAEARHEACGTMYQLSGESLNELLELGRMGAFIQQRVAEIQRAAEETAQTGP
jgi:hypothetical protein